VFIEFTFFEIFSESELDQLTQNLFYKEKEDFRLFTQDFLGLALVSKNFLEISLDNRNSFYRDRDQLVTQKK
jgi:hypothetical protein